MRNSLDYHFTYKGMPFRLRAFSVLWTITTLFASGAVIVTTACIGLIFSYLFN